MNSSIGTSKDMRDWRARQREIEEERRLAMSAVVTAYIGYTVWQLNVESIFPPTEDAIWHIGNIVAWACGMDPPCPITDEEGLKTDGDYAVGRPDGTFFIPCDRSFASRAELEQHVYEIREAARAAP